MEMVQCGCDPTSAMQNADVVLIHSSLIILSQRTFIRQTLGHSLVHIRMLGPGIKLDRTLAHSLKWVIQQWAISRREVALPIHQVNISQLTTVLRHRGFTLTPDTQLVIKIPGDVQTTRMTVI